MIESQAITFWDKIILKLEKQLIFCYNLYIISAFTAVINPAVRGLPLQKELL